MDIIIVINPTLIVQRQTDAWLWITLAACKASKALLSSSLLEVSLSSSTLLVSDALYPGSDSYTKTIIL